MWEHKEAIRRAFSLNEAHSQSITVLIIGRRYPDSCHPSPLSSRIDLDASIWSVFVRRQEPPNLEKTAYVSHSGTMGYLPGTSPQGEGPRPSKSPSVARQGVAKIDAGRSARLWQLERYIANINLGQSFKKIVECTHDVI